MRHKFTLTESKRGGSIRIGSTNPRWTGAKVGYSQLHKWVRKIKPVPKECVRCGLVKKLQLSNNGVYDRNPDNWEYLCPKCHVYKDGTVFNLKNSARKLEVLDIETIGSLSLESRLAALEAWAQNMESTYPL